MRRPSSTLSALVFAAAASIAACQPPAPAAPPGLAAADKAAIDSLEQMFPKMVMAGDFAALTKAYYSDDAVFMPPNMPAAAGHPAIEAAMKTLPPVTGFQLETREIDGVGDLAYVWGRYRITFAPPGAPAIPDSGKYLEVWRRQADGSWRSARDMFNSDVPMPAPVPPKGKGD